MSNLGDWITLPQAAARWDVTRARVHRLVTAGRLPESKVTRAGDRWMLDPEFVSEVEQKVKDTSGRYRLDAALKAVAEEEMIDG